MAVNGYFVCVLFDATSSGVAENIIYYTYLHGSKHNTRPMRESGSEKRVQEKEGEWQLEDAAKCAVCIRNAPMKIARHAHATRKRSRFICIIEGWTIYNVHNTHACEHDSGVICFCRIYSHLSLRCALWLPHVLYVFWKAISSKCILYS